MKTIQAKGRVKRIKSTIRPSYLESKHSVMGGQAFTQIEMSHASSVNGRGTEGDIVSWAFCFIKPAAFGVKLDEAASVQ